MTLKLKLDSSQFEKQINKVVGKLENIEKTLNKQTTTQQKINSTIAKATQNTNKAKSATDKWAKSQQTVNSSIKQSNQLLGNAVGKLKSFAKAYIGIMGMRAVINTTDGLIGAQNKLNYTNATALGVEGFNSDDGTYSNATLGQTQEAMDKIYASSQKVRGNYQSMIANVSKNMVLAGNAFGNNIDNAIRFEEIMTEAYAVGGASAEEMATSMYQLTQALGAGTLAGDELRSVREGAPLAYQAIEKFAQGIYKTDESLKDLAADGKITSDIVIAAIMDSGEAMDNAFAQTKQTFGQTFDQIKSAATYAFQPVMETLANALGKAVDNGMVQKFEVLFNNLAKVFLITCKLISNAITWVGENWYWLRYIVCAAVVAIMMVLISLAAQAIATGIIALASFLAPYTALIGWILVIGLIIGGLVYLATTMSSVCEFIYKVCLWLTMGIMGFLLIIITIALATGVLLVSIPMMIALFVIGIIAVLLAAFVKFTGEIIGTIYGVQAWIEAVCANIGTAWSEMCNNMKSWFYNSIADMLESCTWLLNGINKIRSALGKEEISIEGIREKGKGLEPEGGYSYINANDAYNNAYAEGFAKGEGIQNKINGFSDKLKSLDFRVEGSGTSLDGIANKLGLDLTNMNNPFPNVDDPSNNVANSADPAEKLLGNIADNTAAMADSMELSKEDIEYLRKLASQSAISKFTSPTINVAMTNNNNVSNDYDLKSLAIGLRDLVEEEMYAAVDGVYGI